jgi:hypothetical protein
LDLVYDEKSRQLQQFLLFRLYSKLQDRDTFSQVAHENSYTHYGTGMVRADGANSFLHSDDKIICG